MTETSLKRDRDHDTLDGAAAGIQAVSVEAIPQAAVDEDDMVGPMLPPQAKKRKVCTPEPRQQYRSAGLTIFAFASSAGSGARTSVPGCTPQCPNV